MDNCIVYTCCMHVMALMVYYYIPESCEDHIWFDYLISNNKGHV